jgi:sporulation protein YlmC with PRC-barrel domain
MFNRFITTLAFAGMLAATTTARAQNNPEETQDDRQRERQEERRREREQAADAGLPANFYKSNEIIGLRVDAKGGEKIGEVKNLAINTDNGRIRYAIVDNGSGTLYPMPMPALKFAANRSKAVIDTNLDRMKDAPTFKADGWNTIGDTKWGAIVYQFYGINRDADDDKDRPDFTSATELMRAKVEARKGESLGTVKNLMVDTEKNTVAYAALDFGREGKLFAIPWQAMTVSDNGRKVMVRSVERDDLKDAPGFNNSRWPTYRELGWDKDTNFDSRPPNWVYGMRDTSANGNGGNGNGNNNNNGGDRGVLGGWQTNSKYGQLFRPKTVEKWRGKIVRTETVTPMTGMDPGTAIVVRVDDRNNLVVHLGPEWFVKRQQDKFTDGEEVEVVGSKVDLDQKPIVMATQVRLQGRTMHLRDANGVPAWDTWQERTNN